VTLVQDGQVNRVNLRKNFISQEELDGHLREQGVLSVSDVKLAMLESDGRISVVASEQGGQQGSNQELPAIQ
jgi:uncharacterized membrane protein YcaP (DUF421 family)